MRAGVVVAADGVNSLLGREAGLVAPLSADAVGVGAKEVIELGAARIEERFGVAPGTGAATLILGCTSGVHGGGFLYTNRDTVSLGIVASPEQLAASGNTAHTLLRRLREHPEIRRLVAGGNTVEYSAHLVRENGWPGVPKRLARDGFLVTGEAAGFVMNLGYTVRGMDLALVSGVAAAKAILAAGQGAAGQGVADGRLEPAYRAALEKSGLFESMRATAGYDQLLGIQRLYQVYPRLALDLAESVFTVDGGRPRRIRQRVMGAMRANQLPLRSVLRDGFKGMRSV